MNRTPKPVHKCVGCGLNLRERCGVFESPRDQWARGKCPGYMNEKLLREFKESQEQAHNKSPKEIRQDTFRKRKTEPHWNGHIVPEVLKKT
jgi:hypothetical protein